MSDARTILFEIFEEVGILAELEAIGEARGEARGLAEGEAKGQVKWLAEGEARKAAEIAQNLLRSGFSVEQTAELSGLEISKVESLA